MAMVDVDGSCQLSVDLQPKSIGLVWGLAATRCSVYIHQMNQVNFCNDFGHDDSTINIVIAIIIIIISKSATHSRQTTTPAPHHSVFIGWMPFLSPNLQRQSTEGTFMILKY